VRRQTLPDGRFIEFTYDANGNVKSITPSGRPAHTFNLTPVDLVEDYIPPDVEAGTDQTHYDYNLDRQLTENQRPDGITVDYGYDAAHRLSTITQPRGTTVLGYDPVTGNLKTITAPGAGTLTYGYDGGLLTDTTWSGAVSGNVHHTFDGNFRLAAESVNGATPSPSGMTPTACSAGRCLTLIRD
jgi:YD repeat-containing protein